MHRTPGLLQNDNSKQDQGMAREKKSPGQCAELLQSRSLAVSYSHMGRPHTTIGAERFHFRVRNGIGWFPLAIAARQTV